MLWRLGNLTVVGRGSGLEQVGLEGVLCRPSWEPRVRGRAAAPVVIGGRDVPCQSVTARVLIAAAVTPVVPASGSCEPVPGSIPENRVGRRTGRSGYGDVRAMLHEKLCQRSGGDPPATATSS